MTILLVLIAASILGGAANALAGGGTFLTFPALLVSGMAPVRANATASLVLLPGAFASAWVYRDTIQTSMPRKFLWLMLVASLAGLLLDCGWRNRWHAVVKPKPSGRPSAGLDNGFLG